MNVFDEIINKIKHYKTIAILYHINADGDAIGSSLALYLAFKSSDKIIHVYGEEDIQQQLEFLPESQSIRTNCLEYQQYDLVIVLDAGDLNRLGERRKIYDSSKFTINIDHHVSNTITADINYIDKDASATAEIIYEIIKKANKEITKEIATCLYTAIVTDCGSFRYSNTTSKTHRIAAELLEKGINPNEISRSIYENQPLSKLKILGKILDSLKLVEDNKIALSSTSLEQVNEFGLEFQDLINVANYGLSVEGIELSIFFKQVSNDLTKISLRSKSYFDCSKLAESFDGGGHARAAGCRAEGSLDEAKEKLLEKIREIGI